MGLVAENRATNCMFSKESYTNRRVFKDPKIALAQQAYC